MEADKGMKDVRQTGENARKGPVISLRPHHGLCLQFFEGKGYSDGFTAHMGQVKAFLEAGARITVTEADDEICSRCPNRKGHGCISDEKVRSYDRKVLEICGLAGGEQMTWEVFRELVKEKIIHGAGRALVCPDCQWQEICEEKEREIRRFGASPSDHCQR